MNDSGWMGSVGSVGWDSNYHSMQPTEVTEQNRADALRDSLADDLVRWQTLETRLRRASRDIPQHWRTVYD
jgi:hypothetical protein